MVNIVDHFADKVKCKEAERVLIKYFVVKEHKLCNFQHNIKNNWLNSQRPDINKRRTRIILPDHITHVTDNYHTQINERLNENKRN